VVPGGVDVSAEYRVIPALLALIRRLARRHDVCVFALRHEPQQGDWELFGVPVHNIGSGHTRVRGVLAVCAAHRRRPFDVIHAIWSGAPGMVAVTAARILGVPSVVHVAGGELVALPAIGYGGRLNWKGRRHEAVVLRAATQVTAASGPMLAALRELGIPARRVPLGVDLELWPSRRPVARVSQGPARLIHVASLNRVKDQPTLLRALVALRDSGFAFEMQVVGEDTLGGAIQALAASLGLGSTVRFHGFLTQRALRPLIEASDILVISSRHEAGPLVLHEAAVAGVPTVGTAVGQIADWAPSAARAVPVGEPTLLAQQIATLLTDERQRLAVAQEAWGVATRENADFTACSFEEIYEALKAGG
jgi:glycosyltransferase involved in cell wall biosynthesis